MIAWDRRKKRALIFDVDGTLAETEELHRRAFNEAFEAAGLDWRWGSELYQALLRTTGGKERIALYVQEHLRETRPFEWIAQLHRDKTARYARLMAEGALDLRPGVRELLADSRRSGFDIAIATTTSRPNVDALCLACFGRDAADVFDVIAAGDEVAAKKPAPDVYELALKRLMLPPAACVALEDSRNGVLAAKAAGLPCIAVRAMYSQNDDLSAADKIFDDFRSLANVSAISAALAHAN
ncbi:MAG: HAD-IA family hydrolase [Neomegalonema sp.]|nr:HAD-IA family hydrolase [Neomegalonema sp.]